MAKYKVGDKVRVRHDLEVGEDYGCMVFLSSMSKMRGKVVRIKKWRGCSYEIEEHDDPFWTDEMFEGLAEETPKFKVGDRVIATDNINMYKEAPGTIIEIDLGRTSKYRVKFDANGIRLWSEVHRLIEEEPKEEPTPTPVVNVNVTVNLYENACWYCRKGGLVDLYLAGAMGICPSCGRVCNNTVPTPKKESVVIEFKPKENRPLTTEELKALPNGAKVFTVWCFKGYDEWDSMYTTWRTKDGESLIWKTGKNRGSCSIGNNGANYRTYLEEPKRPS